VVVSRVEAAGAGHVEEARSLPIAVAGQHVVAGRAVGHRPVAVEDVEAGSLRAAVLGGPGSLVAAGTAGGVLEALICLTNSRPAVSGSTRSTPAWSARR
jgi:hypothetical protein